jgi:hypothetical protein
MEKYLQEGRGVVAARLWCLSVALQVARELRGCGGARLGSGALFDRLHTLSLAMMRPAVCLSRQRG